MSPLSPRTRSHNNAVKFINADRSYLVVVNNTASVKHTVPMKYSGPVKYNNSDKTMDTNTTLREDTSYQNQDVHYYPHLRK